VITRVPLQCVHKEIRRSYTAMVRFPGGELVDPLLAV
jgi:hypothetical protein